MAVPAPVQDMVGNPQDEHPRALPFMGQLSGNLARHQKQLQDRHDHINPYFANHFFLHQNYPLSSSVTQTKPVYPVCHIALGSRYTLPGNSRMHCPPTPQAVSAPMINKHTPEQTIFLRISILPCNQRRHSFTMSVISSGENIVAMFISFIFSGEASPSKYISMPNSAKSSVILLADSSILPS